MQPSPTIRSFQDLKHNPWNWVCTLYLAEGIPYAIVVTVAVIMFKRLGISNTDAALYTSWLYLPWVIKPLWGPVVELFKTKRWWITTMQFILAVGFGGVALTLPGDHFFRFSLAFLWLIAFSSATHDIAADGFYMLGLNPQQQAYFVGIRTTFYRIATVIGQGGIVMLAGYLEKHFSIAYAWSFSIGALSVLFLLFFFYHFFFLPKHKNQTENIRTLSPLAEFIDAFLSFFRKDQIGWALAFMLLFRLGESQLVKLASPFMLDARSVGGLGLSTSLVGFIYGSIGVVALTAGGILGGICMARKGLKFWIYRMTIAMNLPNLVYVWLAFYQPENTFLISAAVVIEQFGYGFGFTAYTLYLIGFSAGPYKTAHYALSTGFMALGMMLPGMLSGWLQECSSYRFFFIWVMLCTLPGFWVVRHLKIPESLSHFNKKI